MFLVSILQSIITSSGSSLSTRWSRSSLLSQSPSLEQQKRVATSPSLCEYSTVSTVSWALSSLEKENKWGRGADTHGNNSSCGMKENYKWEWWSKLFTQGSVLFCIKEQQRGSYVAVGDLSSSSKSKSLFLLSNPAPNPFQGTPASPSWSPWTEI